MKFENIPAPAGLNASGPWFYQFEFQGGEKTEVVDPSAARIHESRAQVIFPVLDRHFAGRWGQVSCLDIACHEGWFSLQVAQRGARSVRGIDIREDRVARANLIRDAAGLNQVNYEVGDLFQLAPETTGVFDLTFFLGIFYHLEDIVRGFRIVHGLTRDVCVIEGQVARHHGELVTAWGRSDRLRLGPACVVVDADPNHIAPGSGVCIVPSLEALEKIVRAAGFRRTEVATPMPGMHEQYLGFDRVVLFAFPQ